MPVIDLNRRVTDDWNKYNRNLKSYESYIFLQDGNADIIQSGTSITITVGDIWYNTKKNTDIKITDKGIKIKSKKYVVLVSGQSLALPYNVYGIVVGKGINIFSGGVISTGKIVPGYNGKLRIGFFNASNRTIVLHKGDVLGSCVFFNTEATGFGRNINENYGIVPALEELSTKGMIIEWICDNWDKILSLMFSLVAIIVSILGIYYGV